VDLEAHRPVEVLESRQAEPVAEWLETHPGVEILARDRAEAYAQAGQTAAPDAAQVADRFHLVRNVGDALKAVITSQQWEVPAAEDTLGEPRPEQPDPTPHTPAPSTASQPTPRKRALWEAVRHRRAQGQPLKAIARELDMNVKTVRKYVATDQPPVCYPRRPRLTKLTPYLAYLQQRWAQGCHNARQLYDEVRQQGYTGSLSQLRATVQPWRGRSPSRQPRSVVSLSWLVRCPLQQLTKTEQADVARFLAANPLLALGHWLKEAFHRLVAQRDVAAFERWLHEAEVSGLQPFQTLAASFRQDLAAIMSALTTPWSTAQCEGQICRVKLIKRLGYGRAKPDLLRQRILHRAVAS
jgi:transposase